METATVASYYLKRYNIKLTYPKMPIIYLPRVSSKGGGWFPIEFIFQAFARSKENNEDMVNSILKYHDKHAGKGYAHSASSFIFY
jgi:hypothetical protein